MDARLFLEMTEAQLLKDTGESLRGFFGDTFTEYVEESPSTYRKVESKNPRAAITPLAQVNMVANVTFHLMAQQIAILLEERKDVSEATVYKVSLENVKKLVSKYRAQIREVRESLGQGDAEGSGGASKIII